MIEDMGKTKPEFFSVTFKEKTGDHVLMQISSRYSVVLEIHPVKAFTKSESNCEVDVFQILSRHTLNCESKTLEYDIRYLTNNDADYVSMSIIVKDTTHEKQYSINIPFDGREPNYKSMIYEG